MKTTRKERDAIIVKKSVHATDYEPKIVRDLSADCNELEADRANLNAKLDAEMTVSARLREELAKIRNELIPADWELLEAAGCPRCGNDIYAEPGLEGGCFVDGNPARCVSCGLPGQVTCDEESAAFSADDNVFELTAMAKERDSALGRYSAATAIERVAIEERDAAIAARDAEIEKNFWIKKELDSAIYQISAAKLQRDDANRELELADKREAAAIAERDRLQSQLHEYGGIEGRLSHVVYERDALAAKVKELETEVQRGADRYFSADRERSVLLAQIAAATSPAWVSELSKQLLTLDPMYTNPSCLWRRDEKREAIIFNRDHMGVEVLRIVGDSSRIDHLARLLASIQAAALEVKP